MPRLNQSPRFPALSYHSIDRTPQDGHTVTPELLGSRLSLLIANG